MEPLATASVTWSESTPWPVFAIPTLAATVLAGYRLDRAHDLSLGRIAKATVGYAAAPHGLQMPSLIRLLVVLGGLSGFAYGAIFALATLVQPKPREITVMVPQDRLNKHR